MSFQLWVDVGLLAIGVGLLYWGAEWLIRGSAAIARALGVRPLVIGLTVVAYGSSAPELAVATKTALAHSPPIALGVVIGSCAANISLILGITALIAPPTIDNRVIRRELPVLVGSAIAVPFLLRNGVLSRLEGAILLACAFVFTVVTLIISSRLDPATDEPPAPQPRAADSAVHLAGRGRPRTSPPIAVLYNLAGVVLLLLGADLFVRGGRGLAAEIEMSERMLGLTVMALGTCMPELIAAIVAATRGHASLAVGSVIGANIVNVFLVLGITAYIEPIQLYEHLHVGDFIGLVAITLLGVLMLRGSRRISRVEGAILVAAYIGFVVTAAVL